MRQLVRVQIPLSAYRYEVCKSWIYRPFCIYSKGALERVDVFVNDRFLRGSALVSISADASYDISINCCAYLADQNWPQCD